MRHAPQAHFKPAGGSREEKNRKILKLEGSTEGEKRQNGKRGVKKKHHVRDDSLGQKKGRREDV